MSSIYEPWAGRVVVRDGEGQFAESGGQSWIQKLSDRIGRPQLDEEPPESTWKRGRWRVETREHERRKLEAEVRRDLEGPEYQPGGAYWSWRSGVSDDELEGLIQEQVDQMMPGGREAHTTYINGGYQFRIPKSLENDLPVENLLSTLDELAARYPRSFRSVFIPESDPVDKERQQAYTIAGGNTIVINPRAFQGSIEKSGFTTPHQRDVPYYVWALVHEYGHTLYPHEHEDTQPIWDVAMAASKVDDGRGMSEYGMMGGPHEIFAEAFAEWFVSKGDTTSEYAKMFAERFGW